MIRKDDRTEEQKTTHVYGVVALDRFMSGWGRAQDGTSRCGWACETLEDQQRLYEWVRARDEMHDVKAVDLRTYRPPKRGTAHFHLYVAEATHPAFKGRTVDTQ